MEMDGRWNGKKYYSGEQVVVGGRWMWGGIWVLEEGKEMCVDIRGD